jgi:hypothetical protein
MPLATSADMSGRTVFTTLAAASCLLIGDPAAAQVVKQGPEPEPATEPPTIVQPDDLPPNWNSHLYAGAEIVLMTTSLGFVTHVAGVPWAQVTPGIIKRNLTSPWTFDHDPFTINYVGHPYCGALLFSAGRSTGHSWLVSGLYAFGGSFLWETFFENEVPSANDQISTPLGGMIIGEVMHRASRALLYPGYGKPGRFRQLAATLIDPVGAINRQTYGDAWVKTVPPHLYAHFGVGYQQSGGMMTNRSATSQLHTEILVEHGLTGDRSFQPRRPFDHFELRASLSASPDDLDGNLFVRGLVLGRGSWTQRVRGMGGLFGAFDFNNQEYVRASILGLGPGGTAEIQLGRYGYVEGTAAAYLVPWGAAGGATEGEKHARDYHRGPGLAQLLELKAGRRGLAAVRWTTRAYQIAARLAGDNMNEIVVDNTVGGVVHLSRHHAIGLEGTYAIRRTAHADPFMHQTAAGRAAEFRAFYAITTDEVLGR